jgi:two-component sensor histidine kinase
MKTNSALVEANKSEVLNLSGKGPQSILIKEIQHRTKNSFNMITSLIHIRSDYTSSAEAKTILEDLTLRVKSIADLYTVLYETDSFHEVQIIPYLVKVIDSMLNLSKNISINLHIENITVLSSFAATIGMILVELLSNIIKYAFPDSKQGHVNIELQKKDSYIIFSVEDDGIGMGKDFDISKIKGMGLHLVNLMVSQLGGDIKFISETGTKVLVELPVDK